MATIPPALLDRMELIQVPGYTQEEKAAIAMQHLIPKQIKDHGLTGEQIQIPEDTIKVVGMKFFKEIMLTMAKFYLWNNWAWWIIQILQKY